MIALQASPLNGDLSGAQESVFAVLLHEAGVADVKRINVAGANFSDFGRKWRSALTKLGFITQKLSRSVASGDVDPLLAPISARIPGISGRPYEITPSGQRLISAEVIAAQQEVFLRAILGIKLPSPIEDRFTCTQFSPLKFVIDLLFELRARSEGDYLSFEETALCVITSSPDDGIDRVVDNILDFRRRRLAHSGSVRPFDSAEYKTVADSIPIEEQTLDDYGDCTLRYLKATGLFKAKGRGITLNPIKEELASLIHTSAEVSLSDEDYLVNLWNGADLPTDNATAAEKVVNDLVNRVRSKGGTAAALQTGEDLALRRHELEDQLNKLEEENYSREQASKVGDIKAWIEALINGSALLPNGERIKIPKGEAPAYFEWVIWRAFLAINSLSNKPWEARRFQVDQDFLPTSTAPGNGPDLVFEFADAILVVEVTFTNSSRQEAAEGEPVRRHVAKYAEEQGASGKPVYGLFIAVNIDSNTAHTFRTGDWFKKDDSKINLQIVPIRLDDFLKLFTYGADKLDRMPGILQTVLLRCRAQANQEAPIWKQSVTTIVEQTIRS